jgi:hypothetical protein
MRAVLRGMFAAGLSAAACAQPPAPSPGLDTLQRYLERTRDAAAAAQAEPEREQRQRERSVLLARGEASLARGNVEAALGAFERAALMQHAADTEMALVRAYMQGGEYRRAVSFSAHTAGAHRQVIAGAVLYAWLLSQGGQHDAARRLLETAGEAHGANPLLREARHLIATPAELPHGGLVQPPVRLAPYSVGVQVPRAARVAASGVLVDRGRRALVPLAALRESRERWVRNGLGHVARASVERRIAGIGIAVLRLDPALPEGTPLAAAERDPFPGSPGYAVEYTRADDATPAWPRLHIGFHGTGVDGNTEARLLGIEMPTGARGGPVFDAAGRFAGIAVAHAGGRDRTVMLSSLRREVGDLIAAPAPAPSQRRAPLDEVYEAALPHTLQLITAR